jgi:hypothetical protein
VHGQIESAAQCRCTCRSRRQEIAVDLTEAVLLYVFTLDKGLPTFTMVTNLVESSIS